MATRYYLTARPPEVVIPGPLRGNWDSSNATDSDSGRVQRSPAEWVFQFSTSKTNGGTRRSLSVPSTQAAPENCEVMRWVSPPLAAQTLGGTLDLCILASCANFTVAGFYVHAWISVGDSNVVRGVALDNYAEGSGFTILATFRALAAAQALAAVAIQAGDRLVVEIGGRITTVGIGANQVVLRFGTTDSSNVAGADGVVGSTDSTQVGYIDLSQTLTELGSVSPDPANNSCATAIVIASLPYSSPRLDTTGATSTQKEVWYQWTATFSGRAVLHTFGSNYKTELTIWTGTCGSLSPQSPISDNAVRSWIGRSQSVQVFTAVLGTTYYFRVRSNNTSGTPPSTEQANDCGGSLVFSLFQYSAPAEGDLIVDCQHVAVYRDGVLTNCAQQLFGTTPTGSAIDYTGRTIVDFNSPNYPTPDNTAERLYVTLFGSSPLVEVLDLATLNVGAGVGDMNYMFTALDDGGENLASMVFDGAGRLLLGYFGDNYSVQGELPSVADSGWVRRVDGVAGLEDPGPATPATQFQTAFENSGAEYVEVTHDGNTLFYTSAGRLIKRFDLVNNVQLTDFATLPVQVGVTRPGARGLRLLPPGDGSGGLLVCYGDEVLRLDGSGNVIQSYAPAATDRAQDLDKVEFTPDAAAFYVSDQLTASIFKFDLETGAELLDLQTELPIGQLSGFSVYLGYRAGVSETPTPPLPDACPPSNLDPTSVAGLDGCPVSL